LPVGPTHAIPRKLAHEEAAVGDKVAEARVLVNKIEAEAYRETHPDLPTKKKRSRKKKVDVMDDPSTALESLLAAVAGTANDTEERTERAPAVSGFGSGSARFHAHGI
jgi:hypothetical protein